MVQRTTHKAASDKEADKFKEIPRGLARNVGNEPQSFISENFTESAVKIIPVPFVCAADGSLIPSPGSALKVRLETNSTDPDICYIGKAVIGEDENSPVWQIKQLVSVTIGAVDSFDVDFADGDDLFNNVWTDRETLTYS